MSYESAKTKMTAAVEHLKTELKSIRTGRANPSMLDSVTVDVFGTPTRLKGVANVTAPEGRQLLITPFDPNNVGSIAKAIEKANLNLQPIADGNVVRIKIPPMDSNARQEMVKLCKKKAEEAKVSIRNIRRECNESVKKQKSAGDIAEDQMKRLEKQIQDLTDKSCKEIDDAAHAKEKDVMEI
ncbi:MAG: ribosome recycling factor [Chlamydiales bacterium]|nr:ribosome recycling factor [Chlamydiales bacterium]